MQNICDKLWLLLFFVLTSFFSMPAQGQISPTEKSTSKALPETKIQWVSFEEALDINARLPNPKKVFIDIYTDWCGWCKRLDLTTFAHPEIVKYMQKTFIPVKFDAERTDTVYINDRIFVNSNPGAVGGRKGTHEIAAILLQGKMSYPSCTFLDETGKQLEVIPGYLDAKKFEKLLHYFGDDAYKTVTWEDFEKTFVGKVE